MSTAEAADPVADLAFLWTWFAKNQLRGYSPVYERIALAVAKDRQVLEMVRAAPPMAHMPPLLLAAVHYLLLEGREHPLADVFEGRSDADPAPLFLDLCRARADDVATLLATRRIQTNECGRSAVVGPALTWLAAPSGQPVALVDVGASAGLNLLCDQFRLDYGEHGATGPTDSPVWVDCRVIAGRPPIAERLPPMAARVGIDRSPVDLGDPDDVRWLLACVWPGTGRLERTAAAMRLAQADPPYVAAGDADEVLPGVISDLPDRSMVVVVTTWAFAYFLVEDRRRFVELLATLSHRRPVAWLSAEAAGVVEALNDAVAAEPAPKHDETDFNVLGVVSFDRGERGAQLLGYVHQHGAWIDWRASR